MENEEVAASVLVLFMALTGSFLGLLAFEIAKPTVIRETMVYCVENPEECVDVYNLEKDKTVH